MFYHARFYDPALGTFISPDTMVPQPGVVADYNRFAYVRSNPLKYTDPTGYYSDDEIMQHYGCSDWACVEAIFGDGGQYAGLWGWLYMLQMAEDGYSIESFAYGAEYGQGTLTGRFHRNSNGVIEILDGQMFLGSQLLSTFGGPASEGMFAAYAGAYGTGFYLMRQAGLGIDPRTKVKFLSFDKSAVNTTALVQEVLGAGTDFGPMIMAASPGAGPAAGFVLAFGIAYTGVGLATDLVVDVITPVLDAAHGNKTTFWETVAVEGSAVVMSNSGSRALGHVAPFVGPVYGVGTSVAPAFCYGTNCRR